MTVRTGVLHDRLCIAGKEKTGVFFLKTATVFSDGKRLVPEMSREIKVWHITVRNGTGKPAFSRLPEVTPDIPVYKKPDNTITCRMHETACSQPIDMLST